MDFLRHTRAMDKIMFIFFILWVFVSEFITDSFSINVTHFS